MTNAEEKKLICLLNGGDKDAFGRLFEHYYPQFIAFARNLLRDKVVAEDIVQNVFLKLWVRRSAIDPEKNLKNYILVAVRNEIYCHFRDVFLTREDEIPQNIPDGSQHIEEGIDAKEMSRIVDGAIDKMPQRRREIFRMSRLDKMTNSEIAAKLDLSVRTVEKHIELALGDIRKKIPLSAIIIISLLW